MTRAPRTFDLTAGDSLAHARPGDIVITHSAVYRLYHDGRRLRGWFVAEPGAPELRRVPAANGNVRRELAGVGR